MEASQMAADVYSRVQYQQRREKWEIRTTPVTLWLHAQTILGGFEVASGVAQCGTWDELF